MPTALTDPSTTTYAILAVMVFVCVVMAFKKRQKKQITSAIIAVAALVGLYLTDKFCDSPREECVQKIKVMSTLTEAKDYNGVMKHISDSFEYKQKKKADLLALAELAKLAGVDGIIIFDTARPNFVQKSDTLVEQGFLVQPKGQPQFQRYCVATFAKESDGEWRLTTFKLYNPLQRTNGPEEAPPGF